MRGLRPGNTGPSEWTAHTNVMTSCSDVQLITLNFADRHVRYVKRTALDLGVYSVLWGKLNSWK